MTATARSGAILLALWSCGCDAGGRELQPDELDARDLLGLSSSVAARWDAGARAEARARLMEAWAESWDGGGVVIEGSSGRDEDVLAALGALDERRAGAGEEPVIAGGGEVAGTRLVLRVAPPLELDLDRDRVADGPERAGMAGSIEAIGWRPDEAELIARGAGWMVDLASLAGHRQGAPLRVRAARHAPFGAIHLGPELGILVNPVLLAALEPAGVAVRVPAIITRVHAPAAAPAGDRASGSHAISSGGNPYAFYGSVAECAAAERLRCEDCLPQGSCERTSRDAEDGNAECEALGGGEGRGYYLYCVNLSLAIATVAGCVREERPACPQDTEASNQIARLEVNSVFVDGGDCGGELDECLAAIYGEPDDEFPPPSPDAGPGPDGGTPPTPPAPPPPRDIDVSCGEADCDFSPQCDSSCSSSCDDAFSCDADCNSDGGDGGGNDGCGGCDGCGGDGGDGDGGDSGDGDSGGGDGGCDSGGGDGGGGGGCSGSDCGNGDCGNGDCGNGDCGNDCNSGGGSGSSCTTARGREGPPAGARACRRRTGSASALLALAWAILPLPYLERCRRRARRRQLAHSHQDVPR
jgi:hypothetical protein